VRRIARIARTVRGYRAARGATRADDDVVEVPPTAYVALLRRLSSDCDSVLDVGTGLMESLTLFPCRVRIGLDAHRPYLERRQVPDAVPIHADALELDRLFVPGAVDLVTLVDVIEHFDEGAARELLKNAERIARKRILVFTPRGQFPQEGYDAFGLGGEELQRHRSAWDVEDLTTLGYRVAVLRGFHDRHNEAFVRTFGPDAPARDALLAWKSHF
jgi:hypothetical protein